MKYDTKEHRRAWLILAQVPGIGLRLVARLVEHFGGPPRVLAAGRAELQAVGLKPKLVDALLNPPEAAADANLAWAEREGVQILTRDDPHYPPRLAQVSAPPVLLFVRGDPELLAEPRIGSTRQPIGAWRGGSPRTAPWSPSIRPAPRRSVATFRAATA